MCLFSGIIVIVSLPGPVSSQTQFTVSHHLQCFYHCTGLKCNPKAVGHPPSNATIACMGYPVTIPALMAVHSIPSIWAACIKHPNTVKTNQQGGSFLANTSLMSPRPVSSACGAYCQVLLDNQDNGNRPCWLGVSRTILTDNKGYACFHWAFSNILSVICLFSQRNLSNAKWEKFMKTILIILLVIKEKVRSDALLACEISFVWFFTFSKEFDKYLLSGHRNNWEDLAWVLRRGLWGWGDDSVRKAHALQAWQPNVHPQHQQIKKPGRAMHTCNHRAREVDTERSLEIAGQPVEQNLQVPSSWRNFTKS